MNYDWHERVRRLALASRHATGSEAPWSAARDPGHVPAYVMPALCGLAQELGHPVQLGDLPQDECDCGQDHGPTNLGLTASDMRTRKGSVTIQRGMSPASTARVLGHEIGHARKRATESASTKRQIIMAHALGNVNVQEEGACELGTAAFCEAMGIGTGAFLHRYMGQHFRYTQPSHAALTEAAGNAEALWGAVNN